MMEISEIHFFYFFLLALVIFLLVITTVEQIFFQKMMPDFVFVQLECDKVDVKEECVDEEARRRNIACCLLGTGMDSASEGK